MTAQLTYATGDATAPPGPGPRIIAHIVNNAGLWDDQVTRTVPGRRLLPAAAYRGRHSWRLGAVQMVRVAHNVWVASMIAQHGRGGTARLCYQALDAALGRLAHRARLHPGATVHMPRSSAWDRVEPLVQARLVDAGYDVTVYDPKGPK